MEEKDSEGRKEGWMEGRRMEGVKRRVKEGRNDGRMNRWMEGRKNKW